MKDLSALANWFLMFFLVRFALRAATLVALARVPIWKGAPSLRDKLPELIGPGLVISAVAAAVLFVLNEGLKKSDRR